MNEKILLLNKVFSPSSPIKKSDFFSGRITQIDKICDVINEDGQHAIVYGERGVGKTSFANIISESLTNIYPIKITCNKNDTFHTLWKQAFNQIQFSKTIAGLGFKPEIKKNLLILEILLILTQIILIMILSIV